MRRMYPTLFQIGGFEITTFGLAAASAFVVGYIVFRAELKRRNLAVNLVLDLVVAAAAAGFVGARINFILEHWDDFRAAPWSLIWSRAGFTWFGGVAAGLIAVIGVLQSKRQPLGPYADAVAPALALVYVFGRLGCQLSGDGDYGLPSDLPWAMSYRNGIVPTLERVHPTPVYEMLVMLAVFGVLWRLRKVDYKPWWLFGWYLALAGAERFTIEFIRRNPRVFWGLTEAQLVSALLFVGGVVLVVMRKRRADV